MTKPFRCHDAEACALGQKPCPTPWACGLECPVKEGTHKPSDALHNIEEPNGKAD